MLALVFILVMKGSPIRLVGGSGALTQTVTVTDTDYKAAVNTILDDYAKSHDVGGTYDALILLRVPKEDQEVHFDLVVAFGKLESKDTKDGEARLSAVKAANPWLHL